jgi:hypothetical protein
MQINGREIDEYRARKLAEEIEQANAEDEAYWDAKERENKEVE